MGIHEQAVRLRGSRGVATGRSHAACVRAALCASLLWIAAGCGGDETASPAADSGTITDAGRTDDAAVQADTGTPEIHCNATSELPRDNNGDGVADTCVC